MGFNIYLDKSVCITLVNGYFYRGRVIDCDDTTLTILDVKNQNVTLQHPAILSIAEVVK